MSAVRGLGHFCSSAEVLRRSSFVFVSGNGVDMKGVKSHAERRFENRRSKKIKRKSMNLNCHRKRLGKQPGKQKVLLWQGLCTAEALAAAAVSGAAAAVFGRYAGGGVVAPDRRVCGGLPGIEKHEENPRAIKKLQQVIKG